MEPELLLVLVGQVATVLLYGALVLHCAASPKEEAQMEENNTPPSRTPTFPDFNGNGVPDYNEGWFWRGAWRGFAWLVRTFAKPHTLVYKGVEAAEKARASAAGAQ